MIKLKSGKNVLFGIDASNVEKLKEGKPIHIKGKELGLENDFFIAYGETLEDIQKELGVPSVQ